VGYSDASRAHVKLSNVKCQKQEVEQSPVFLLFLDCVWQLLQQCPTAFEISETYLTTLWDSAFTSIFDTFLFNCHHQRFMATTVSFPVIFFWVRSFKFVGLRAVFSILNGDVETFKIAEMWQRRVIKNDV